MNWLLLSCPCPLPHSPEHGSRTRREWGSSDDTSLLAGTRHRLPSQKDTFLILPTANAKALKSPGQTSPHPDSPRHPQSLPPTLSSPLYRALRQDSPLPRYARIYGVRSFYSLRPDPLLSAGSVNPSVAAAAF